MNTPTDPYAMIETDSHVYRFLLSVGWTVTDSTGLWSHMEPPHGS